MTDHILIYNLWHNYASTKNVEKLIELYSQNAVFESPLVPILLKRFNGVLKGKEQIYEFFSEGVKRRPNDLIRWFRTGTYFFKDNILIWEYPRKTPNGEQIDILELMEIEKEKIIYHRIYWGWLGTQLLITSAINQLTQPKES